MPSDWTLLAEESALRRRLSRLLAEAAEVGPLAACSRCARGCARGSGLRAMRKRRRLMGGWGAGAAAVLEPRGGPDRPRPQRDTAPLRRVSPPLTRPGPASRPALWSLQSAPVTRADIRSWRAGLRRHVADDSISLWRHGHKMQPGGTPRPHVHFSLFPLTFPSSVLSLFLRRGRKGALLLRYRTPFPRDLADPLRHSFLPSFSAVAKECGSVWSTPARC
jgi:hypothetical protein